MEAHGGRPQTWNEARRGRNGTDGAQQQVEDGGFQENSGGKTGEEADESSSRGCVADNVGLTAERAVVAGCPIRD
jgi:hypothetical protein